MKQVVPSDVQSPVCEGVITAQVECETVKGNHRFKSEDFTVSKWLKQLLEDNEFTFEFRGETDESGQIQIKFNAGLLGETIVRNYSKWAKAYKTINLEALKDEFNKINEGKNVDENYSIDMSEWIGEALWDLLDDNSQPDLRYTLSTDDPEHQFAMHMGNTLGFRDFANDMTYLVNYMQEICTDLILDDLTEDTVEFTVTNCLDENSGEIFISNKTL